MQLEWSEELMKHRIVIFLAVSLLFIVACASASERDTVAKEVKNLYSENPHIRESAVARLTAGGPVVVSALIPVICDRAKLHFDRAWPLAARVLGQLRAQDAAPCLAGLLMYNYPAIGPVVIKPDETLINVDPAFAALIRIGEPAVPAIRKQLPFLGPEPAIMALRVLRKINTPSARDAAEAYARMLHDQVRFTEQVIQEFTPQSEPKPKTQIE
jgi:hypothetical protein